MAPFRMRPAALTCSALALRYEKGRHKRSSFLMPASHPKPAIAFAPGDPSLLTVLAIGRALVAAPHLPFPGVVQIIDDSAGYRWLPIEYVNRAASPPALNPQYAQRR